MNARQFNRKVTQAARVLALVLAVPAVVSACLGNTPGFAAGVALLAIALRAPSHS